MKGIWKPVGDGRRAVPALPRGAQTILGAPFIAFFAMSGIQPATENPHFIAARSASATSFVVESSISDGPAFRPASLAKRLFLIPI